jgi:hypothetical protein
MTDSDLRAIAAQFAQYRDCKEITLRGDAIVEYGRAVIAAHEAQFKAIPPLPVIEGVQ